MILKELKERCKKALYNTARNLGYIFQDIEIVEPPNAELGDLSTNLPLRILNKGKNTSYEVALNIVEALETEEKYVARVVAHQNGYINFFLKKDDFMKDSVNEILSTKLENAVTLGENKTVTIEHTAVNPNKALHVGHARNLVIGDSLARILSYAKYRVRVLNYIDDSGSQIADIIVGFKFLGIDENPGDKKFDQYCGDEVYVRVNRAYEQNEELKRKKAFVLREIEKGEGEIAEYSSKIVNRVVREQLKTCWRLNAFYDLVNWETHIVHSGMWTKIFEMMKERGIAKFVTEGENAGCWVITDKETNQEKVIVRSDGTTVYVAKDIPYAAWKLGLVEDPFLYIEYAIQPNGKALLSTSLSKGDKIDFSSETAITITDIRQAYLQKIVSSVIMDLFPQKGRRYVHRGYEVVSLSRKTSEMLGIEVKGNFVQMSGRKGTYVNVDTILDDLKNKALVETEKRNKDLPKETIDRISESIAIAALRYELVKQEPEKMIVFDIESSLKLEGDTGPYLLYSYARACRILEKANEKPDIRKAYFPDNPELFSLIKKLSYFDEKVITSLNFLAPNEIAKYSYSICDSFNVFYERVPVIQDENESTRNGKLCTVEAFKIVLGKCLDLLGIPKEEKI